MLVKAPYLPLDKLRVIAENFLTEHNRDERIPVPIERIIEDPQTAGNRRR